jgi:hypothetical protein
MDMKLNELVGRKMKPNFFIFLSHLSCWWVSCIVKMINVLMFLLMELKMRLLGVRILLKGEMVTPFGTLLRLVL